MANVGIGGRARTHGLSIEEFVPSFVWVEEQTAHTLLIGLPGFKKEELKLQVDSSGQITITGERQVKDKKIHFEQTCKPVENSDVEKISGEFDGELLHVILPKLHPLKQGESKESEEKDKREKKVREIPSSTKENQKEESRNKNSCVDGFPREILRKWGGEEGKVMERAMEILRNNKGILVTAVLAFSLGVFITRKLESSSVGE